MLKKLQVLVVLTCMLSYLSSAVAGTVSIGTVSARGDMRVDSYLVNGNATLFDGSVVETGQASANLRLSKGTEITMGRSSRGTLHRDRLVLQQGQSELAASSAFQVEVNGLRVTPSETSSRGAVSMQPGDTVEVAALTGSFGVTNNQGVLLATVRPGHALSFAMQTGAGSTFVGTGPVSTDGTNYFITINGAKYQITGKNLANLVGKNVKVTGTISGTTVSGAAPAAGATAVVSVATTQIVAAGVIGGTTASVIAGVAVVGGVGAGVAAGIYESAKTPASP